MLVHNARQNRTKVINFQGSAPKALTENMVQNVSDVKVNPTLNVWGNVIQVYWDGL